MRPELQKTRTPEQLEEIFSQMSRIPLTDMLTAPVMKYIRLRSQDAGEVAEELLKKGGYKDCPFPKGAEGTMLTGDFICLFEAVADKFRQKNTRHMKADFKQEFGKLMLLFIAWSEFSKIKQKGTI